jgi:hypothetical protein
MIKSISDHEEVYSKRIKYVQIYSQILSYFIFIIGIEPVIYRTIKIH